MRIVLVNPPKTDVGRADLTPPLGLLRLATVARMMGAEPVICDLNLLWHLDPAMRESFYQTCMRRLSECGGQVYAFTSMCVDSHVALELARQLKQLSPSIITLFGGSHFSAIAEEVQKFYPWVDYVIRGEGEVPFAALIKDLGQGQQTPRAHVGTPPSSLVALSSATPSLGGVIPLPKPAFDLVDMGVYFAVNPRRLVDFESGRGCRFKCSFCYSPEHYGPFRDFEISAVLTELSDLRALRVERFALADDNFLNDSTRARRLCEAIRESRFGLNWGCYATFPQINEEIARLMQEAGCDRVFCGIDAVGRNSQRAFRKAFLPLPERFEYKLRMLDRYGIRATCAFLLCPPSHEGGVDLEATVQAALAARLSGAQIRLNTLTPYNGTPAMRGFEGAFVADDIKPRLLFDLPPAVEQNPLAEEHPDLFPFHSRFVERDEWHQFVPLVHCLSTLLDTFPRSLDSLWRHQGISPTEVGRLVLYSFDDLLRLEKAARREEEQVRGFDVLRALASHASVVKELADEDPLDRPIEAVELILDGV